MRPFCGGIHQVVVHLLAGMHIPYVHPCFSALSGMSPCGVCPSVGHMRLAEAHLPWHL